MTSTDSIPEGKGEMAEMMGMKTDEDADADEDEDDDDDDIQKYFRSERKKTKENPPGKQKPHH